MKICVHLPDRALQWQAGLCPKKTYTITYVRTGGFV